MLKIVYILAAFVLTTAFFGVERASLISGRGLPLTVVWDTSFSSHVTYSSGNRAATYDGGVINPSAYAQSTTSKSSGKWYFEVTMSALCSGSCGVGLGLGPSYGNYLGANASGWGWDADNGVINNGSFVDLSVLWGPGDVLMVAVDVGGGKAWWGLNGTWAISGNPATGTNPVYSNITGPIFAAVSFRGQPNVVTATLATVPAFTIPSGFSSW